MLDTLAEHSKPNSPPSEGWPRSGRGGCNALNRSFLKPFVFSLSLLASAQSLYAMCTSNISFGNDPSLDYGPTVTNVPWPSLQSDVANKGYIDLTMKMGAYFPDNQDQNSMEINYDFDDSNSTGWLLNLATTQTTFASEYPKTNFSGSRFTPTRLVVRGNYTLAAPNYSSFNTNTGYQTLFAIPNNIDPQAVGQSDFFRQNNDQSEVEGPLGDYGGIFLRYRDAADYKLWSPWIRYDQREIRSQFLQLDKLTIDNNQIQSPTKLQVTAGGSIFFDANSLIGINSLSLSNAEQSKTISLAATSFSSDTELGIDVEYGLEIDYAQVDFANSRLFNIDQISSLRIQGREIASMSSLPLQLGGKNGISFLNASLINIEQIEELAIEDAQIRAVNKDLLVGEEGTSIDFENTAITGFAELESLIFDGSLLSTSQGVELGFDGNNKTIDFGGAYVSGSETVLSRLFLGDTAQIADVFKLANETIENTDQQNGDIEFVPNGFSSLGFKQVTTPATLVLANPAASATAFISGRNLTYTATLNIDVASNLIDYDNQSWEQINLIEARKITTEGIQVGDIVIENGVFFLKPDSQEKNLVLRAVDEKNITAQRQVKKGNIVLGREDIQNTGQILNTDLLFKVPENGKFFVETGSFKPFDTITISGSSVSMVNGDMEFVPFDQNYGFAFGPNLEFQNSWGLAGDTLYSLEPLSISGQDTVSFANNAFVGRDWQNESIAFSGSFTNISSTDTSLNINPHIANGATGIVHFKPSFRSVNDINNPNASGLKMDADSLQSTMGDIILDAAESISLQWNKLKSVARLELTNTEEAGETLLILNSSDVKATNSLILQSIPATRGVEFFAPTTFSGNLNIAGSYVFDNSGNSGVMRTHTDNAEEDNFWSFFAASGATLMTANASGLVVGDNILVNETRSLEQMLYDGVDTYVVKNTKDALDIDFTSNENSGDNFVIENITTDSVVYANNSILASNGWKINSRVTDTIKLYALGFVSQQVYEKYEKPLEDMSAPLTRHNLENMLEDIDKGKIDLFGKRLINTNIQGSEPNRAATLKDLKDAQDQYIHRVNFSMIASTERNNGFRFSQLEGKGIFTANGGTYAGWIADMRNAANYNQRVQNFTVKSASVSNRNVPSDKHQAMIHTINANANPASIISDKTLVAQTPGFTNTLKKGSAIIYLQNVNKAHQNITHSSTMQISLHLSCVQDPTDFGSNTASARNHSYWYDSDILQTYTDESEEFLQGQVSESNPELPDSFDAVYEMFDDARAMLYFLALKSKHDGETRTDTPYRKFYSSLANSVLADGTSDVIVKDALTPKLGVAFLPWTLDEAKDYLQSYIDISSDNYLSRDSSLFSSVAFPYVGSSLNVSKQKFTEIDEDVWNNNEFGRDFNFGGWGVGREVSILEAVPNRYRNFNRATTMPYSLRTLQPRHDCDASVYYFEENPTEVLEKQALRLNSSAPEFLVDADGVTNFFEGLSFHTRTDVERAGFIIRTNTNRQLNLSLIVD